MRVIIYGISTSLRRRGLPMLWPLLYRAGRPQRFLTWAITFILAACPCLVAFQMASAPWIWTDRSTMLGNRLTLTIQTTRRKKLSAPWLSVMGNHDYGGAGCLADWQGQIEYTEKDPDKVWTMPFQYYQQRVAADG